MYYGDFSHRCGGLETADTLRYYLHSIILMIFYSYYIRVHSRLALKSITIIGNDAEIHEDYISGAYFVKSKAIGELEFCTSLLDLRELDPEVDVKFVCQV